MVRWIACKHGKGYLVKSNIQEKLETNFDKNAVGILEEERSDFYLIWLIGSDSHWVVSKDESEDIDVAVAN